MGPHHVIVNISFRRLTVALLTITSFAIVIGRLSIDSAAGWILRVALTSTSIALVPGALIVLAWYPRRSFDAIEWVGLSLAVGFGANELLTIAALGVHWSPVASLFVIGVVVLGCAARAFRRQGALKIGRDHL